MGTLLEWELDSNSLTPDQFHFLWQAVLFIASEGGALAVDNVYHHNILPAQFWCERYGPHLLYLLLCQGNEALASELARDMTSEVCRAVLCTGTIDKMTHVLQGLSNMYSRHLCDRKASALSLSLRLVRFIMDHCNRRDLFFHSLCKLGMYDLVEFALDVMGRDLHILAFSALDSRRMSPLYLAAAKGHLDIVKLLVGRGCPLMHPSSEAIPEVFAAVVCLRSTFSNVIKARVSHEWSPVMPKNWLLVHMLFPGSFNCFLFSPKYSPSLRENACEIIEFFVSEIKGGVSQVVNHGGFFGVLGILASFPCLDLATPLLHLFLHGMDHYTPPIGPEKDVAVAAKLCAIVELFPHPLLFSSSRLLLDQILVDLVPSFDGYNARRLMLVASEQGLWTVVRKCFSLVLRDILPFASKVELFECVILNATLQGEVDFLTSVLRTLQEKGGNMDLIESLCVAVMRGKVETLSHLLTFVDDAVDVRVPLSTAIQFHRHSSSDVLLQHFAGSHVIDDESLFCSLIEVAARFNNLHAVEKLFELRNKVQDFEDGEFWWRVFAGAAERGHECLALQAVGCMSESQVQQMAEDSHYSTLLGWSCYWGLKDLLECIPCTTDAFLVKPSESCPTPPWVSALIGGHIGKLTQLNSFPSWKAIQRCGESRSDLGDFPDMKMLLGSFHRMLSGPSETDHKMAPRLDNSSDFCRWHAMIRCKIIMGAICCKVVPTLEVHLEHLGRYAGYFVMQNRLLTAACSIRDNLPAVKLILQCLFNSPSFTKFYSDVFSLCVQRGEVDYVRAFVCAVPLVFECLRVDYPHNLNSAVLSGSPETVDCILELLGSDAPEECYRMTDHGEYPLLTAFALGRHHVITKSSLVAVAARSTMFDEVLTPDWREQAFEVQGWFDLLMHTNSSVGSLSSLNTQSVTHHSDQPISSLVSLRNLSDNHRPNHLVEWAVRCQEMPILQATLAASDGMFSENVCNCNFIYDPTVWEFLNTKDYRMGVFQSMAENIRKPLRESALAEIVKMLCFEKESVAHLGLSELSILTETYNGACVYGKLEVVDCLLSLDVEELRGDEVKLRGIEQATAMGHFQLAADLMLKMDRQRPFVIESANIAHSFVFGGKSYSEILNSFFSSLCCTSSDQRLPLASLWMVRSWSQQEAQLVLNRPGCSTFAPPNPWVFSDDFAWDLSVNVDWNSFSECTLASPCVPTTSGPGADGAKFRHVPLLVESIVFSRAVLGLLSPQLPRDSGAALNLFEYCKKQNYSSVIVSCQVWPAQPSFANGVLNFSYHPDTKTVQFVDLERLTKPRVADPSVNSTDPTVEYHKRLSENLRATQQQSLQSLGEHYEGILGRVALCQKCSVSVKFSADILCADDGQTVEFYSMLASVQLGDLAEGLGVVSKPSVLYKALYQEHRAAALAPVKLRAFEQLVVSFEVCSNDPSQPVTTVQVSLEHLTLSVNVHLPRAPVRHSNNTPFQIPTVSSYSKLVEDLEEAILSAELSRTREEAVRDLGKTLAPLFASSLKVETSISSDFLAVMVDDEPLSSGSEATMRFEELDTCRAEYLVYLKCTYHLERFLRLFCKMLRVFQCTPRLSAHVSSLFEAGFRVVLNRRAADSKPVFSEQAGVPLLSVPVPVLLSSEHSRASLLPLFHDILATVRRSNSRLESLLPLVVPASFSSSVDLNQSEGLLYPELGEPGVITVQMVDYYGNTIKTTPTVDCSMDVRITHVTSRSVVVASSSVDPSSRLASSHLLVTEGSGGTFKIEWTPRYNGLYSVSIHINNMAVSGSPYKCFSTVSVSIASGVSTRRVGGVARRRVGSVARSAPWKKDNMLSGSCGTRQTDTTYPIVCVVSHSLAGSPPWAWQCQDATPPPVQLLNKKPIRPSLGAPVCSSREDFLKELGRELDGGEKAIHHISMCSAYGGAKRWGHVTSPYVSIHISNADSAGDSSHKFKVTATPLGRGYYQVSLSSIAVGSFSIFASCACCNSVLTMHWKDGRSFLPSSIYTVPGALCSKKSTLVAVLPREWASSRRKGKQVSVRRKFGSLT